MKKTIILLFFATIMFSCEEEPGLRVTFSSGPYPPNNYENINLRPYLGFANVENHPDYGKYIFLCDTVNPPKQVVRVDKDMSLGSRPKVIDLDKKLKPNTQYYWQCRVESDGLIVNSEVYSFKTVDLGLLANRLWQPKIILKLSDYINYTPDEHDFDKKINDPKTYFAHPIRFRTNAELDSVSNVIYHGDEKAEIYPPQTTFKLEDDNLSIGDWDFTLINFGYYEEGALALVYKQKNTDITFIKVAPLK